MKPTTLLTTTLAALASSAPVPAPQAASGSCKAVTVLFARGAPPHPHPRTPH